MQWVNKDEHIQENHHFYRRGKARVREGCLVNAPGAFRFNDSYYRRNRHYGRVYRRDRLGAFEAIKRYLQLIVLC